jgi:uncharacterized membrane protein YeaQ/YmgE (transglycosylase-associated protein family)
MKGRQALSRKFAIFAFWLLGFGIGCIGYLALPGIAQWFSKIMPNFLNEGVIGALIAGIAGSAISTFTVVTWANKTSNS